LQLPSNDLHNTVSNSNVIVVMACLPRHFIVTTVVSLFIRGVCLHATVF
jgi:hypothetical protein